MDNKKYSLIIDSDGKTMSGYLSNTSFPDDIAHFNPLTVLGELMNTVLDYWADSPNKQTLYEYSFKETYQQHPFFQDKDCQREIDTYIHKHETGEKVQYGNPFYGTFANINGIIFAIARLHECFLSGKNISMNDLELIKSVNGFKFTLEVGERDKNPFYRNGGELYKVVAERPGGLESIRRDGFNTSSEFHYTRIDFDTHVTAESFQEFMKGEEGPIGFTYTCYSLEEVIFALWHYLIFHGYTKFNKCHHCETYFATTTLKQKYCTRNSPYEGYTDLNCEQAVRDILQKLNRRKKVISAHFYNRYQKAITPFTNEHIPLETAAKKYPTVENLKALERFTDKKEVKKNWYIDKYYKLPVPSAYTKIDGS